MSNPFLLFQLYGPLSSWGDIAVGEVRPSNDHPSKSAVLGLIAAALGLRRDQDEAHRQLAASLRFALRLEHAGTYLHDYHTVQTPPGRLAWKTRRDELEHYDFLVQSKNNPKAATPLQSYRDYYADQYAIVCLWKTENVGPALHVIAQHLKQPCFQLYLGRKACPPALPLMPFLDKKAGSWKDALDYAAIRYRLRLDCLLGHPQYSARASAPLQANGVRYFWEGNDHAGLGGHRIEVERWDTPASRKRWQFQPRREYTTIAKRHE